MSYEYRIFLIPIILKISKIGVFWVMGSPFSPPPRGEGPEAQRISKREKSEYCITIKIVL